MRAVVADETGLVKVVQLETNECLTVAGQEEQDREECVAALCWDATAAAADEPYRNFHLARRCGLLERWAISSEANGTTLRRAGGSEAEQRRSCSRDMVGLACMPSTGMIVCCSSTGEVHVERQEEQGGGTQEEEGEGGSSVFQVGGPISGMCAGEASSGAPMLACGGNENDLKVWDVRTQSLLWKAKNVPHDKRLQLKIPIWVTAVAQLRGETSGNMAELVTGTAHRHVRIYDTRARRQPVQTVDHGDYRITALKVCPHRLEAVVGDCAGGLTALDLRTMKARRRFVGPAGAVRSLSFHPTLPVFASVGLDRMLRLFNVDDGRECYKVYLKQRLTCVMLTDEKEKAGAVGGGAAARGREGGGAGDEESSGEESGLEYDMGQGGGEAGGGGYEASSSDEDDEDEEELSEGEDESEEEQPRASSRPRKRTKKA